MKSVISYNPLLRPAAIDVDVDRITNFPPVSGGRKVQAAFWLPDRNRLHFATDRIGAFDQPHLTESGQPAHYPGKGVILNQLALWGNALASRIMPTDMLSLDPYREQIPSDLFDRASGHVHTDDMIRVEFIVRSSCEGSMAEKVGKGELFYGQELPTNLTLGSVLPRPFFTPTTKAPKGQKDKPLTLEEYFELMGDRDLANYLYGMAVLLHLMNRSEAEKRGLDRPDQKLEFGRFSRGKLAPRAGKYLYRLDEDLESLFSSLASTSGMGRDAWREMPHFDFPAFCEYWFWNDRAQEVALIDEYGTTDDGRYRDTSDTAMGRMLVVAGTPELGKAFLENYLCKEYFRLASKKTGKGGYAVSASQEVVIPDAVLQETGRRNLRAMLRLTGQS